MSAFRRAIAEAHRENARLEAAARAIAKGEGWEYSGASILTDMNPRAQKMVRTAGLVIDALDALS